MRPAFGLALFPDPRFLRLARRAIEEEAELFELSPETLWRDAGTPEPAAREGLLELVRRAGRPVVAHGLMACLAEPDLPAAVARSWEARLRADQADFEFGWCSEHLAFAGAGGRVGALPLPLPDLPAAVAVAAARLRRLAQVTGVPAACENVAAPFRLCAPAREPELLNEVAAAAGCDVVLDLHNAWVAERTGGLPLLDWLEAVDLERVIELHLSGGQESDPAWLPSGRSLLLDSHDAPVPPAVWAAAERALPRCPRLRAVVLERHPDSLDQDRVAAWEADVRRARGLL